MSVCRFVRRRFAFGSALVSTAGWRLGNVAARGARAQLRAEDLPLAEQTVAQVQAGIRAKVDATTALVQSARDQLKWSLLK